MRNRKPMNVKIFAMVHNLVMFFASLYMVIETLRQARFLICPTTPKCRIWQSVQGCHTGFCTVHCACLQQLRHQTAGKPSLAHDVPGLISCELCMVFLSQLCATGIRKLRLGSRREHVGKCCGGPWEALEPIWSTPGSRALDPLSVQGNASVCTVALLAFMH